MNLIIKFKGLGPSARALALGPGWAQAAGLAGGQMGLRPDWGDCLTTERVALRPQDHTPKWCWNRH